MRKESLLVISLVCLFAPTANAGRIFPPANLPDGATSCPGNQALAWTGDSVVCADVTPDINTASCPNGQTMVGIKDGVPTCTILPTMIDVPSCASGFLLQGVVDGKPVCIEASSAPVALPTTTAINAICPSGTYMTGLISGIAQCGNFPVSGMGSTGKDCGYIQVDITPKSLDIFDFASFAGSNINEKMDVLYWPSHPLLKHGDSERFQYKERLPDYRDASGIKHPGYELSFTAIATCDDGVASIKAIQSLGGTWGRGNVLPDIHPYKLGGLLVCKHPATFTYEIANKYRAISNSDHFTLERENITVSGTCADDPYIE